MAISEQLRIEVKAEVGKAVADLKKLQGQTKKNEDSSKSFGRSMLKLGLTFGTALVAFRSLTKFISSSIDAFAEQEQASARLGAVLEATGHAAGFNLSQIKAMAAEMQRTTIFGDELVISAQAVLATFRNIGGDTFPRTMNAAADMATVMGQDLKSAVVQLGKALNDPAVGMTLLNRSGVTFSETQKKLVKG